VQGHRGGPILVVALSAAVAIGIAGGTASAGGPTKVKAVDFEFTPKTVTVGVGAKVVWKQKEGEHNVTAKRGSFRRDFADGPVSRKFNKAGVWRYFCRFHKDEKMKGKVIVG